MATPFTQIELDKMNNDLVARKPPEPAAELHNACEKAVSVNCSNTVESIFVTFAWSMGNSQTYAFNPAVTWHFTLIIVKLMQEAGWTDLEGEMLVPGAKRSEFSAPSVREKRRMLEAFENFIPSSPDISLTENIPKVVAVSVGGSTDGITMSFRLATGEAIYVAMNPIATYRLFAMLSAMIEVNKWIGPSGQVLSCESVH